METLRFWAITLLLATLAGLGGFWLGRDWVGAQLAGTLLEGRSPQAQATTADQRVSTEALAEPPTQLVAELEAREPSAAEQLELTHQELGESTTPPVEPRREAEAAPPAEAPARGGYTVTAGSYTQAANAQRVKEQLEGKGFRSHVTEVQVRERTYYRVVVGVYGDRAKADEVAQQIQQAGYVAGVMGP